MKTVTIQNSKLPEEKNRSLIRLKYRDESRLMVIHKSNRRKLNMSNFKDILNYFDDKRRV